MRHFGTHFQEKVLSLQSKTATTLFFTIMIIVSTRDFRANQGRYLNCARNGEDVIIKSRDHGSFKITPVTKDDTVYSTEELASMVAEAEVEYNSGKGYHKRDDETMEQFLNRLTNV